MEKKTTFMHQHLVINFDDHVHFLVIIELINYVPIHSFIVKMPAPFLQYPFNMYCLN